MDAAEIVRDFYNKGVAYEWERLERHPAEFAITKHYLDKYIRPGDKVLDIGGGPGRYSFFLAEKGCDVTLMDLSDANIAFAQSKAAELGLRINVLQGDARYADHMMEGPYDHILLMGPLYHLLEEKERAQAVKAALGLLKTGGTIYISFISLQAGMIYYMKCAPQLIFEECEQPYIRQYLKNETYCGDAFTKACFIAPKDIMPFLGKFPLEKLHLLGQEGIVSPCENMINACEKHVLEGWIQLALAACEREELLAYAEHLMYIGRKR